MSENPEVDSPETSVPVPPDPSRADQARKGLLVFFALAALGSGVFQGLILRSGKPIGESPWLVYALMWTPGIASIVARLAFREGVRDVSFRIGGPAGWKAIGLAWLLPPVVGFAAYGLAWGTGLARFEIPALAEAGLASLAAPVRFAVLFGLSMTLVSLLSFLSAVGEEIGWRGTLLPLLLRRMSPRRATFVLSLFWAFWHLPLFWFSPGLSSLDPPGLAGWYASLLTGTALLTWFALRTGYSIPVAAAFHAAMDIAFLSPATPSMTGTIGAIVTVWGLVIWIVALRPARGGT